MRRYLPLLVVLLIIFSLQPAKSFLEFEDFLKPLRKKHKQDVHIINHVGAPILINEARVDDRGSEHFKTFTGILDTYKVRVTNTSGKRILAYRIAWTLKHPFENWVFRKIEANSIDSFAAGASQTISFKRDKHYRQDAYYYAEIAKVEFDDESVWEAPEHTGTMTVDDIIKQELHSIDNGKSIENMSLEEIQEILPLVNGTELNKPKIEEPKIEEPKIEEVNQEEVIVE